MLPFRTILHPTDFSKQAEHAYRVALLIARETGARLIVLHIDEPSVMANSAYVYTEMGAPFVIPKDYHARIGMLDRKLFESIADAGIPVETRLEEGEPSREILRVAEEVGCDLIVMGTHGRTGLGRLLMGSVAEAVVRRSPCPVFTLRFPLPGEATAARPPAPEVAAV